MDSDNLRKYINIINESALASLSEKWKEPAKVSPAEKGKYEGKTKSELLKQYNALKARGPHKKGSPEYGRMRELAFAIRAKTGWGKVKETGVGEDMLRVTQIEEKWGVEMKTKPKDVGKWEGWTLDRLRARKKRLMDKPERTAAETKEVKQINFAIRAKTGWGKAKDQE